MYGKLNERKLHQNDFIMSCQKAREQLSSYLDDQAKRVNVDSAKKRAVVQHMDYEGFRQMVLGANIFPTKSKQLYNFSKGQSDHSHSIPNGIMQQKIQKPEKVPKKPEQIQLLQKVQGKSQMHCFSFREFKKKFMDKYPKQFDQFKTLFCYNLLKQQNQQRLRKIFNTDCQGDILLKITNVCQQVLTEMSVNNKQGLQRQVAFMLIFYQTILNIPTMNTMTLTLLSKKQKKILEEFVDKLKDFNKKELNPLQKSNNQ